MRLMRLMMVWLWIIYIVCWTHMTSLHIIAGWHRWWWCQMIIRTKFCVCVCVSMVSTLIGAVPLIKTRQFWFWSGNTQKQLLFIDTTTEMKKNTKQQWISFVLFDFWMNNSYILNVGPIRNQLNNLIYIYASLWTSNLWKFSDLIEHSTKKKTNKHKIVVNLISEYLRKSSFFEWNTYSNNIQIT